MAEATEIPEARDPFERRVALTIAVLAVVLSIVSMVGDNAKMEGLLDSTQAADAWGYYQAKSIKEHSYQLQKDTLEILPASGVVEEKRSALLDRYTREIARYDREKEEEQGRARALEETVERKNRVNDRCDLASLQLQVAVVLGSIAILVRLRPFWIGSMVLGITGALTALSSLLR